MPLLTVRVPVLAELRDMSDSIDSLEDLFCTAPAACMGSAELDSCAAHFTRFLAPAVGAMLLARLRAACVRLLFFCGPSEKAACILSFAPAVAPSACRQSAGDVLCHRHAGKMPHGAILSTVSRQLVRGYSFSVGPLREMHDAYLWPQQMQPLHVGYENDVLARYCHANST